MPRKGANQERIVYALQQAAAGVKTSDRCATSNKQRKRLSDRQKLNLLSVQKSGEDQNHS
jgi:hypothetical protein